MFIILILSCWSYKSYQYCSNLEAERHIINYAALYVAPRISSELIKVWDFFINWLYVANLQMLNVIRYIPAHKLW